MIDLSHQTVEGLFFECARGQRIQKCSGQDASTSPTRRLVFNSSYMYNLGTGLPVPRGRTVPPLFSQLGIDYVGGV